MTTRTIHISKAGFDITLDEDAAPFISKEHAVDYGYRQLFNDVISGIKPSDFKTRDLFIAECKKVVEKKLAAFMNGELRAGGGRTTDPVAKEAKRLMLISLAKLGVKVAEARVYTLATWAKEFAKDPDEAIQAICEQAGKNVAADSDFLSGVKLPTIHAKESDEDASDEEE